jgi:hypothetical protein
MWDLSLSCEDDTTLVGCECSFAEELMNDGLLRCADMGRCPEECPICLTCMRLMGCNGVRAITSSTLFYYVICGVFGLALFGTLLYVGFLWRQHSLEGDEVLPVGYRLWLAPAGKGDDETSAESMDDGVWLAPVTS